MSYSNCALLLCITLHVTSGTVVFAADDPIEPLNRRVGVWTTKTTFKKVEWTPEERTVTGVETIKWILDNKLLQGDVVAADGTKSHWLMNYDAEAEVYRYWYFDNKNSFPRGNSVGHWNARSGRIDWNVDVGNGFRGKSSWQYSSKDKLDWSMTVSDPNGKLMMDMRGTLTRNKQDAKKRD